MPVFPGDFLPDDVPVRTLDASQLEAARGNARVTNQGSIAQSVARTDARPRISWACTEDSSPHVTTLETRRRLHRQPPPLPGVASAPSRCPDASAPSLPLTPPHMPLPSPPDGGFHAAKISSAPGARLTRRRRDDEASLPAGSGDSLAWLGARMPSANTDPTDSESGASGGRSAAPTPPGLEAYLARRLSVRRPLHPS
ncbi:hypothetical protein B2J93_6024 [Marssonina coronariae]|uniref:Uncharacterized protein n=1 Tax=Diplocarpon coronariae TaxID=2795749 RepID=A0A218YXP3_9HELO|nr:hypothetical protein B2J93_6024 [Marssonina coronariae]